MPVKICQSSNDIRQLLVVLSAIPPRGPLLSICGILRNVLRGFISFEAFVGDWPHCSVVVLRPTDREEIYSKYHCVYGSDKHQVEKMLGMPDILPWHRSFILLALSEEHMDVVERLAEANVADAILTDKGHWYYVVQQPYASSDSKAQMLPDGFRYRSLEPKHAAMVNEVWEHGGDASVERRIQHQIGHIPSGAVYNELGAPVCWSLGQFDGSGGMSVTLPAYRNKGLATKLFLHLQTTSQHMREPVFGYVAATNHPQLKVTVDKLGGRKLPGLVGFVQCSPKCEPNMNSKM